MLKNQSAWSFSRFSTKTIITHSSRFWQNHFANNLLIQRINWNIKPSIAEDEKKKIIYSLKAWQLGETSDGSHLLKAATRYAKQVG